MICRDPGEEETWREYKWLSVRSMGRGDRRRWIDGRYVENPDFKTTLELALIKARELVETGRLRDPAVVKAESDARADAYLAERRAKEARKAIEFRERACQALGMNQDDGSEIIDRVVAAMRWAIEQ